MYTNGCVLLNVCGGESHCRAELSALVFERINTSALSETVTVSDWPRTGSGGDGESEKGSGESESGSRTAEMESERVSSVSSPEKGAASVRRVAAEMVDEGKSK